MKPLLLHGPAIEVSRRKLQDIRQQLDVADVLVFEKDADLQQILTNLQSQSLFDNERLIILENPPEAFQLSIVNCQLSIVLWFDHEVDIKKWPGFEVLFFPESREVSIFPFLDMLATGDKRAYLEMDKLKKAGLPAGRQGFDMQYFITMIFYLLRNLVATPKKAPDFVKKKLQKQRQRFNLKKIETLYKDILWLDFKIKSGFLEKDQAEFLLIDKFIEN